jgi:hypothetical protein
VRDAVGKEDIPGTRFQPYHFAASQGERSLRSTLQHLETSSIGSYDGSVGLAA